MHQSVSVQGLTASGKPGAVRHLAVGQSTTFSTCLCGGCPYDLLIPTCRKPHAAGRIIAYHDHWRIDNLSRTAMLVVEDMENPCHLITVPASRLATTVSFELARVTNYGTPLVNIFGPEPAHAADCIAPCPAHTSASGTWEIDRRAAYFAVLLALCEPRLRGDQYSLLPTSADIAISLKRRGIDLSSAAVDTQIEYLVQRLSIRPSERAARRGPTWRKLALAQFAIRHGLVLPDDLARSLR